MVVISCKAACIHLRSLFSTSLLVMLIVAYWFSKSDCHQELPNGGDKYLNIKCDFERIPGGGCHLRESYCSLHTCICKPDFPINIADKLCITRYKSIGEQCTYSQECQPGSYCFGSFNQTRMCICKRGHAFSYRSRQCLKGLKGSQCHSDVDCTGAHQFCSISVCECMVEFEWYGPDELCVRRARFGEYCESSINCKVHDEFSECEPQSKQCQCGQFLSRKYALDEVTQKCVSCPVELYNKTTNRCRPEKLTVEYSLFDQSGYDRNSHQYVYIALSMTPFIVFALIGFIYRYVNPNANYPDNLSEQGLDVAQVLSLSQHPEMAYSLPIDFNGNPIPQRSNESQSNLPCLLSATPLIPEPPPSYENSSQDLPPPYHEVVQGQQQQQLAPIT